MIKWWKGKWWPSRDMVWVLVGVRGCVLRPIGHSLVTLFPYLCRLRTGCCISLEASHRFIIPSTYLGMGVGKTRCSLVVDLTLSGPTDWRWGWWRSLHHTESGTQEVGGLESKFGRGPRPHDRRVVGWSCLCLGCKRGVCFGVPSWAHWFANRRHVDTTCLLSSNIVRTRRWKMVKWFWLLTTCLKVA